jgi:hypothetical protein
MDLKEQKDSSDSCIDIHLRFFFHSTTRLCSLLRDVLPTPSISTTNLLQLPWFHTCTCKAAHGLDANQIFWYRRRQKFRAYLLYFPKGEDQIYSQQTVRMLKKRREEKQSH